MPVSASQIKKWEMDAAHLASGYPGQFRQPGFTFAGAKSAPWELIQKTRDALGRKNYINSFNNAVFIGRGRYNGKPGMFFRATFAVAKKIAEGGWNITLVGWETPHPDVRRAVPIWYMYENRAGVTPIGGPAPSDKTKPAPRKATPTPPTTSATTIPRADDLYFPPVPEMRKAFALLKGALRRTMLPTGDGGVRRAEPGEFMLMNKAGNIWQFKHSGSRNYLFMTDKGALSVPKTNKPFLLGYFDEAVELDEKRSGFVFPDRKAWPIGDLEHANMALTYIVAGRGQPEDWTKVLDAIEKKWGDAEGLDKGTLAKARKKVGKAEDLELDEARDPTIKVKTEKAVYELTKAEIAALKQFRALQVPYQHSNPAAMIRRSKLPPIKSEILGSLKEKGLLTKGKTTDFTREGYSVYNAFVAPKERYNVPVATRVSESVDEAVESSEDGQSEKISEAAFKQSEAEKFKQQMLDYLSQEGPSPMSWYQPKGEPDWNRVAKDWAWHYAYELAHRNKKQVNLSAKAKAILKSLSVDMKKVDKQWKAGAEDALANVREGVELGEAAEVQVLNALTFVNPKDKAKLATVKKQGQFVVQGTSDKKVLQRFKTRPEVSKWLQAQGYTQDPQQKKLGVWAKTEGVDEAWLGHGMLPSGTKTKPDTSWKTMRKAWAKMNKYKEPEAPKGGDKNKNIKEGSLGGIDKVMYRALGPFFHAEEFPGSGKVRIGTGPTGITGREASLLLRGRYATKTSDSYGDYYEITKKGRDYYDQLEDKLFDELELDHGIPAIQESIEMGEASEYTGFAAAYVELLKKHVRGVRVLKSSPSSVQIKTHEGTMNLQKKKHGYVDAALWKGSNQVWGWHGDSSKRFVDKFQSWSAQESVELVPEPEGLHEAISAAVEQTGLYTTGSMLEDLRALCAPSRGVLPKSVFDDAFDRVEEVREYKWVPSKYNPKDRVLAMKHMGQFWPLTLKKADAGAKELAKKHGGKVMLDPRGRYAIVKFGADEAVEDSPFPFDLAEGRKLSRADKRKLMRYMGTPESEKVTRVVFTTNFGGFQPVKMYPDDYDDPITAPRLRSMMKRALRADTSMKRAGIKEVDDVQINPNKFLMRISVFLKGGKMTEPQLDKAIDKAETWLYGPNGYEGAVGDFAKAEGDADGVFPVIYGGHLEDPQGAGINPLEVKSVDLD